jgi:hypothetical protein
MKDFFPLFNNFILQISKNFHNDGLRFYQIWNGNKIALLSQTNQTCHKPL